MPPVLHMKVSFDDARWTSIPQLLEEARSLLASGPVPLKGLAEQDIHSAWRDVFPDHEPPSALKEFLLRAGADAPFLNPNVEDSYRLENYQENRDFAIQFMDEFAPGDRSSAVHLLDEDGSLLAAIVVIACDAAGGTYYCMDASDDHSQVFQLHAPHGDLKVESMTMLDFLRLELINYWVARTPSPR
jgi:hypothetical protein